MRQRIITAILAGALFLTLIIIGDLPFTIFVYCLGTIAQYEILKMKKLSIFSLPGFLSVIFLWVLLIPHPISSYSKIESALFFILLLLTITVLTKNRFTFDDVGFLVLSTMYIGVGFYYLIETRMAGIALVFFALFVIWATDTGAYFVGKTLGKRKLWPEISPNKTIEGFVGGIVSAVVVAFIFQLLFPVHSSMIVVLIIAALLSVFGQIGDLVESALKRHYIVKDSGHLLPGHGGILDRFDSLLFVLPILHFLQLI